MPDKSAESVATIFLNRLIPDHACPVRILTDNGTEYKNQILERLTKEYQIGHMFISPRHPEANGKIERWHRFLHDGIRKLTGNDPTMWERVVPKILFSYRVCPTNSGKEPFYLFKGRKPRMPLDTLLPPRPSYTGQEPYKLDIQQYHQALQQAAFDLLEDIMLG